LQLKPSGQSASGISCFLDLGGVSRLI
jgi:hypothetical protein